MDYIADGWASGTHVWVADKELAWTHGVVTSNEKATKGFKVQLRNVSDESKLYEFVTEDIVSETDNMKYMNSDTNVASDNLVDLVVLNEPEILQCLENRYKVDKIYTYTGPILIALNPFKALPAIYNNEVLEFYYNFGIARSNYLLQQVTMSDPPPHIYAIADKAYRDLMHGVELNLTRKLPVACDQSILISGESGAGKTESTKLILQYLTIISSSQEQSGDDSSVMDKLMHSNPILESFGNAKTLRNNNSSRFGKFIELKFSSAGGLVGGFIKTYVLEKVRVVSQQTGERNYHIFYELAAGGTDADRKRWGIQGVLEFLHMGRADVSAGSGSIDDVTSFKHLRGALDTFGFTAAQQKNILDTTAALLHLGTLAFDADADGEGSDVSQSSQSALGFASRLLGVPSEALERSICFKMLLVENDVVLKPLNREQAADSRDALMRTIYCALFDWIVSAINVCMQAGANAVAAEIGILDIFGFETFKNNYFEQLCINYANETLQQHFNKYVFEFEQLEYREEGIEWNFIDYPDGQLTLDLIEMRGRGIFAMIDDECFIPRGSDANLAQRMYASLTVNPCFQVTEVLKRQGEFIVHHYAGDVVYSTKGFVEKNKNELPREVRIFSESSNALLSILFDAVETDSSSGSARTSISSPEPRKSVSMQVPLPRGSIRGDSPAPRNSISMDSPYIRRSRTVGGQFKEQLLSLMDKIQETSTHYVRCLKPNDKAAGNMYVRPRVVEQLTCGGVMEAIKVARSGYPYRILHAEFYGRYRSSLVPAKAKRLKINLPARLLQTGSNTAPASDLCTQLLDAIVSLHVLDGMNSSLSLKRQSGKTKVFLSKDVYHILEGNRARSVFEYVSRLQALYRMHRFRRWFVRAKKSAKVIRKNYKAHCLRVLLKARSQTRAEMKRIEELKKEQERLLREQQRLVQEQEQEKLKNIASAAERAKLAQEAEAQKKLLDATQKQLVDVVAHRKRVEEDEAKHVADLSRTREVAKDRGAPMEIGPKRFETPSSIAESIELSSQRSPLSLLGLQMYLKKSNPSEKSLYKQQFPTKWSTSRLLQYFRNEEITPANTDVSLPTGTFKTGVKLGRLLVAAGLVITDATLKVIQDEIESSGDVNAREALKPWLISNGEGRQLTSMRVFEGKLFNGTRCFVRMYRPISFIIGTRELEASQRLTNIWTSTAAHTGQECIVPSFIGTIRPNDDVIASITKQWGSRYRNEVSPVSGELWLLYKWDDFCFKTLHSFPRFPQSNFGFAFGNDHTIYMGERKRFLMTVVKRSLEAIEFLHSSGYCHNSLSMESIWLSSLNQVDWRSLRVKLTELGTAQKLSASSGPQAETNITEDFYQLGLILLTLIVACFSDKISKSARTKVLKLAEISSESIGGAAAAFQDEGHITVKDFQRIFELHCNSDFNELLHFLKSVKHWEDATSFMLFKDQLLWNLVKKLMIRGRVVGAFAKNTFSAADLLTEFSAMFANLNAPQ